VATHFFKSAFANLLMTSTDFDGADFAATPHYQMIPLKGTRQLQLKLSPGEQDGKVRLGMKDAGIFEIKLPASVGSFSAGATFVELDSTTEKTLDLTLSGIKAGRTILVVEDMKGVPIDWVSIAVKKEIERTYNLHTLEETFHKTPRSMAELKTIMGMVETIWLRQANIRLRRVKESALSFGLVSFGDPMHLHESPIPHFPFSDKNVFRTIQEELAAQGFKSEHINVISTWAQKAKPGFETRGDTPLGTTERTCYVVAMQPMQPTTEATVVAHEIGHALGLGHDNHNADQMMAEGRRDSFLLSRFDIDIVNTSDRP